MITYIIYFIIVLRGYNQILIKNDHNKIIQKIKINFQNKIKGHKRGCTTVKWKPNGEFLLMSGGEDGTIRCWDIRKSASCIFCFDQNKTNRDLSIVTSSPKNKVVNYPKTSLSSSSVAHNSPILRINLTIDGNHLLSLSSDDLLRVWDVNSGANSLVCYFTFILL